jgi:hypothetical protein
MPTFEGHGHPTTPIAQKNHLSKELTGTFHWNVPVRSMHPYVRDGTEFVMVNHSPEKKKILILYTWLVLVEDRRGV